MPAARKIPFELRSNASQPKCRQPPRSARLPRRRAQPERTQVVRRYRLQSLRPPPRSGLPAHRENRPPLRLWQAIIETELQIVFIADEREAFVDLESVVGLEGAGVAVGVAEAGITRRDELDAGEAIVRAVVDAAEVEFGKPILIEGEAVDGDAVAGEADVEVVQDGGREDEIVGGAGDGVLTARGAAGGGDGFGEGDRAGGVCTGGI